MVNYNLRNDKTLLRLIFVLQHFFFKWSFSYKVGPYDRYKCNYNPHRINGLLYRQLEFITPITWSYNRPGV